MTRMPLLQPAENGQRYELTSPTAMPKAGAFLWNQGMMIQATCRGYAVAQFMQPEPAKYSYAPNLEAKTFMQPEQNYYAHHPGRFVYVKDEATDQIFSAPYEPVRAPVERFVFSAGQSDIRWTTEHLGIRVEMTLSLPTHDVTELWTVKVTNMTGRERNISVYPYFTLGYMSWMNQSAEYREDLGAIVGSCVTPYQKVADYWKNKYLKDKTYLLCETKPTSWETNHQAFEVQYRLSMKPGEQREFRFLFGPAYDDAEIRSMKERYLSKEAFDRCAREYAAYIHRGRGCLKIQTPDPALDNYVNNWLPRQVYYHGDVNRLTTDPQTRNYLQDNMGMNYIRPEVSRKAFVTALSQQEASGAMPDGIILVEGAELKYINQVPHTDHCVWLPLTLEVYLSETGDYAFLDQRVKTENGDNYTVFERFSRAMDWLLHERDERGLSYIAQGDWCDPLNMVGYKGKGELAAHFRAGADEVNKAANKHLWDGDWFARGITDDNSFAILSGATDAAQRAKMMKEIEKQLYTPYGVVMFAPAFLGMREDVGRVTQKHPGSAENGAVYNHAAVFYIHSLYSIGETDRAYELLRQLLPGPSEEDYLQRGQLPIYVPNYYRGAWHEFPRTAGRSSHLFNTGTVSWIYRVVLEGLCGLKGDGAGLQIDPQLPEDWDTMKISRRFRGATFNLDVRRSGGVKEVKVMRGSETLPAARIDNIRAGTTYDLVVLVP
ncbi:unnamed protein product [Parascedosporium putredinis]|uniref:Uncharacterized protein n=1 Tax=Parascedosporium putredinis TaxID=1442378 RepID=A0A9P1MBG4_9PEZI|nr:unnamed protein product [Parascedosporium putredinis]CAI7996180.1 unnamed protein product [Parascedosporium putredinis]